MPGVVNPWEVKGDVDYGRLLSEFGLRKMPSLPNKFDHVLFRRGLVYAHRDFERIIDAVQSKKPFVMMTGLMPSGKFHFGHKMVADEMLFYQKLGATLYIAVADIEAYNTRSDDRDQLEKIAIEEYLLNYIALGLDHRKCDFYFQSKRSVDGKKASAYYSLAGMLSRNVTLNEFRAIYGEMTPAKMASALLQAADILHPSLPEFEGPIPVVVPVGVDQDPHLRLARDLAQRAKSFKFGSLSSTYHVFQPGLKGGKMSSSDPSSFIALTDSPIDAARKIRKYAFSGGQPTVEEHRKKGGNPDVDIAFQLLRYGLEPDDKKLQRIEQDYRSGRFLTSELKEIAIEKVSGFLSYHQKQREKARSRIGRFLEG